MRLSEYYEVGSARVGELGVISTPAAQAARLAQIKSAAAALGYALSEGAMRDEQPAQYADLIAAYAAWWATLEDYRPDWTDRLWGATADQIESYAQQLDAWRDQARAAMPTLRLGVPVTEAALQPAARSVPWGWLVAGAASLALVAVVVSR